MRKFLPRNVELYFEDISTGTGYEEKVLVDECYYDVIVIDGRHRNNCMTQSLKRIKPNGIIILDNSDRTEYAQGIRHLTTSGFRMIEFSGFCPIVNFKSKTAIFYRSQNILGI
jgi:predicted O-methyltransferase YrrM